METILKSMVPGICLSVMLLCVGCSQGPRAKAPASVGQGSTLPHTPSANDPIIFTEENSNEPSQESAEPEPDTFFYFSYDDSSSTASKDLTKFYIENGLLPYSYWGRAYEYLNAEDFEPFGNDVLGPFDVSLGLHQSDSNLLPGLESVLNSEHVLYSLGVNVSGPTLTKAQRPNIVMTLLVDISGSMASDYAPETRADIQSLLDVAKFGLKQMTQSLKEGDVINLVVFDTSSSVALEGWQFQQDATEAFTSVVDNLATKGSTNLNQGIELAYRVAQRNFDADKSNRVIILTDAFANTGEVSPTIIADSTVINGLEGIYFAGIGIGNTFDELFLNELTDIGKGNYAAMITPEDAERIFVKQFASFIDSAVKDVRFKLEFPEGLTYLTQASSAEEVSVNEQVVQTTNFAYNTEQFFLEHFYSDSPLNSGTFKISVTYQNEEGQMQEDALTFELEEYLGAGTEAILSAAMVSNLAQLVSEIIDCQQLAESDLFNAAVEAPIYIEYRNLAEQYCQIANLQRR